MSQSRSFLFQLNHPAHYHLFINTIRSLREQGHAVHISIKDKDILKDLLKGESYHTISSEYRKKSYYSIIKSVIRRDKRFLKLVRKIRPDVMIGTSPEIGHIRRFVSVPALFFGEDDVTISRTMFLGALSCYPFFDCILSPEGCNNSIWNKKTVFYSGFQKLAYLHPNRFTPDRSKVDIPGSGRFFILRFARLAAYHDMNASGISNDIAAKLIRLLSPHGQVLITSERDMPAEFEQYRFRGDVRNIHHYLYYADLYIGDSQSMAVEAAMLGTPSIRFNNFVGKISVLDRLENKYGLTCGIPATEPERLFAKVAESLSDPGLKTDSEARRRKMLSEMIDVTAFFTWFIGNYPSSLAEIRDDPALQLGFRKTGQQ
jgi:uncharacterized protein